VDEGFKLKYTKAQAEENKTKNDISPRDVDMVLNLSTIFQITVNQRKILEKGLSYVPTAYPKPSQVEGDLKEFYRKIQLFDYFDGCGSDQRQFIPKSTWKPPKNRISIETLEFITSTREKITRIPFLKNKSNLTKTERQAIRELKDNRDIIIKPADKGSNIVILDRQQYLLEAHRQLDNTEHYQQLDGPIYLETRQTIANILDKLLVDNHINKKQRKYLAGQHPRPRVFYILPKIHKHPDTWTIPGEVPTGRPIVSDCGSESYNIAEYIDHFLNPISKQHPSYIKDTYHFVQIVNTLAIQSNSFLFTMDVESLYTNIETDRGLTAVRKAFKNFPQEGRPDGVIIQLLHLGLTRNDFEFNGKYYLQIKGTAMGKRFAPAYANIYMADWEHSVLEKCPKKPLYYYRYLDDIWGVWTHTQTEMEDFTNILNNHHPSIKIKTIIHKDQIDFLDTTVFKLPHDNANDCKLATKVYFKPTDTHALLHTQSNHPQHTFKGLVKSQLSRFYRICSKQIDFERAITTLFLALRQRGYTKRFLRHLKSDFLKSKMKPKQKQEKLIIPLITTFSPQGREINRIVKNNFEILKRNNKTFENYTIIAAYKRHRNLKDILVKSKIKGPKEKNCGSKNCKTCEYLVTPEEIRNHHTNISVALKSKIRCDQHNVVYAIQCRTCGLLYIGETGNTLRERFSRHLSGIKTRKDDRAINKHFIQHGIEALTIMGLDTNVHWTIAERKRAEKDWIHKMKTFFPNGLNLEYGSTQTTQEQGEV